MAQMTYEAYCEAIEAKLRELASKDDRKNAIIHNLNVVANIGEFVSESCVGDIDLGSERVAGEAEYILAHIVGACDSGEPLGLDRQSKYVWSEDDWDFVSYTGEE